MQRSAGKKRVVIVSTLAGAGVTFFAATPPLHALTIVPIYNSTDPSNPTDATVASDPNAAVIESTINADIAKIDSYIANPITISVIFEETTNGLADSNSNAFYEPSYASYHTALQTKQTLSAVDNSALATLPAGANNPVNSNTLMFMNGNILNTLGFGTTTGGFVEFNAGIVFDSRANPVIGKYDLQSAIAHELDEVLSIGGAGSQLNSVATGFNGTTYASPVGPLDLFRYSASGVRSYNTSSNVVSYFSVNGGASDLVHFNQAGSGDSDYSDWGNGNVTGAQVGNSPDQVQDAYSSPSYDGTNLSVYPNLGSTELTALDAVGWDLTPAGTAVETGAVPEPTSLSLFAIGAVGLLARRRRVL